MDGSIIKTPLSDEPRYVPYILDTQYGGVCIKNIRMHRTSEFANFGGITRTNE